MYTTYLIAYLPRYMTELLISQFINISTFYDLDRLRIKKWFKSESLIIADLKCVLNNKKSSAYHQPHAISGRSDRI